MRASAKAAGCDKMSLKAINAEIARPVRAAVEAISPEAAWGLDTNVLFLPPEHTGARPPKLWDALGAGRYLLAYDPRILHEYQQVLSRPKFGSTTSEVAQRCGRLSTISPNGMIIPNMSATSEVVNPNFGRLRTCWYSWRIRGS